MRSATSPVASAVSIMAGAIASPNAIFAASVLLVAISSCELVDSKTVLNDCVLNSASFISPVSSPSESFSSSRAIAAFTP